MSRPVILTGLSVEVRYDRVDQALRKFKKKVQESGRIQELRARKEFEKPTTKRKKKAAQAKQRWAKKVKADLREKRLY